MLYDKKESFTKAAQMIKKAMEIVRGKMSPALSKAIVGQLVLEINGSQITAGDATISNDLTQVRVRINANLAAGYVENESEQKAWTFIMTTVRHECLHAFQWLWVARKAGHKGIKRMTDYIATHDYKTSILEIGARMYENENNARMQDFNTDLAIFVA